MPHQIVMRSTGNPDVLEHVPAERPRPGPGQVLVRNTTAAVNYIDTIIRRGEMPPGSMPPLPHVPGVEGAGIVETMGAGASALTPGDRVVWMGRIGSGGYSPWSVLDPFSVARLPDGAPAELAAALPVGAVTAWQILVRIARVAPGETVLVRAAAGGLGVMLIQLARHLGATVIAIADGAKRDFLLAAGADYALSRSEENLAEAILDLTGGRGVE